MNMVCLFPNACRPAVTASVVLLLLLSACVLGCAGTIDPISPTTLWQENTTAAGDSQMPSRMLWGYYRMHLNADHTQLEIEPVRGTAFHLNALAIIEAFDPSAVGLGEMFFNDDGSITVEVLLTHPFPEYKEYTGFDVRGTVMLPSLTECPMLGVTIPGINVGENALLNPDGYTRRWNPTEYSAAQRPFSYFDGKLIPPGLGASADSLVNPYKTFITDNNRNYFMPGNTHARHYIMSFAPGPHVFGYAIDASWDQHTLVPDLYSTAFGPGDPSSMLWAAKNPDYGTSSYWQCDWFEGTANNRDEACSTYGGEKEISLLFSPAMDIPANTSNIEMQLMHTILLDEDYTSDYCGVLISPDNTWENAVQIEATNHLYDTALFGGYHAWSMNWEPTEPDVFDISETLAGFPGDKFWLMFAFVTWDGDHGENGGGWTLDDLRIIDYNGPPTAIPDAFPETANSMEPYSIAMSAYTGELQCSLGEWAGGSAGFNVTVSDWQGDAKVGLQKVSLEAPGIFDATAHPSNGSGPVSTYTYEFTIQNSRAVNPGIYPAVFSIEAVEDDPTWLPLTPLTAYQVFNLEVVNILPPYCDLLTGIHSVYGGTYQLIGSQVNTHLDCSFMPYVTTGGGVLLFDGGISGGNENIQAAAIDGDGGDILASTLIQRTGTDAGNALVLQPNEFNGHLLVVSDSDPDNLCIYSSTGELLKEYDLGGGEASINEPVCVTTDPETGDIYFVGHRGNEGVYLERWVYVPGSTDFEYLNDVACQLDLEEWLGSNPRPLGIAINSFYDYLYLFHGRSYGSLDVFDITQTPPTRVDIYSVENIFGQSVAATQAAGLRKLLGGDIVIDRANGEQPARCRILVFANMDSGGSTLVRFDAWGQVHASAPLGSTYSCMAINNLLDIHSRSLVLFPIGPGAVYSLFLPPDIAW